MTEQFTYRASKDQQVFVSWRGRVVTTLRGERASRFLAAVPALDGDGIQQLLARVTGNFKRGNEQ